MNLHTPGSWWKHWYRCGKTLPDGYRGERGEGEGRGYNQVNRSVIRG